MQRKTYLYNLHMILAVGYRVRSPRGTQFRQWATAHLAEYLVKGFVMNDERLKNPGGWDYFDELLARIREIRASEKRFYQKVRDLFALSDDYRSDDRAAQLFFAGNPQNKLLFAVTGQTRRRNRCLRRRGRSEHGPDQLERLAHKHDVVVAKNYLSADEVDTLNRLVVIFLEQAELRVKERKQLHPRLLAAEHGPPLAFNERAVLTHAGSVSPAKTLERIARERFDRFDENRRIAEARQADAEEIAELEHLDEQARPEGK